MSEHCSDGVSLDCHNTLADYEAYAVYARTSGPRRLPFLKRRAMMFTAGPVALALYTAQAVLFGQAYFPGGTLPSVSELLYLGVVTSALGSGLSWWYQLWSLKRSAIRLFESPAFAPWREPYRVTILPDRVEWNGAAGSGQIPWTAISSVELGDGLYLFPTPEQAFICPGSAFADRAAMERVFGRAKALHTATRH